MRPQIVVVICPPLLALCVIELMDGSLSTRRFVIQLSGLLIVQIFLSVEVLFTMTVVGVLALAAHWVTGTPEQRRALVGRLPVLALPFVIAGAVSAWDLLQVLDSSAYATNASTLYPTDGLAFFVPMPGTWVGGALFSGISGRFPGGPAETNAYLGLPLLLILGRYLITRRHTRTAQVLAIPDGNSIAIWIVGPYLYMAGHLIARLPYSLISGLPLLDEVLSGRTAVYLALAAAVALAIWLASPRKFRLAGWACAVIALACVLPNLVTPSANNVSRWTNPVFFRTRLYTRYLRPGETVLPIGWGPRGESFMWQAEDHMYWNMANGYWVYSLPAAWYSRVTEDLWVGAPHRGDGPLMKDLLIRRHVSAVVVQAGSLARWQTTLRAAGLRATANVGGITVYQVPSSWGTRTSV